MPTNDALMLIGIFAVTYVAGVAVDRLTARWARRRVKEAQGRLRDVMMKQPHRLAIHRRGMVGLPDGMGLTARGKGMADLAYKLDLGVGFCMTDQRDAVFFVEGAEPVMCGRVILRPRIHA